MIGHTFHISGLCTFIRTCYRGVKAEWSVICVIVQSPQVFTPPRQNDQGLSCQVQWPQERSRYWKVQWPIVNTLEILNRYHVCISGLQDTQVPDIEMALLLRSQIHWSIIVVATECITQSFLFHFSKRLQAIITKMYMCNLKTMPHMEFKLYYHSSNGCNVWHKRRMMYLARKHLMCVFYLSVHLSEWSYVSHSDAPINYLIG